MHPQTRIPGFTIHHIPRFKGKETKEKQTAFNLDSLTILTTSGRIIPEAIHQSKGFLDTHSRKDNGVFLYLEPTVTLARTDCEGAQIRPSTSSSSSLLLLPRTLFILSSHGRSLACSYHYYNPHLGRRTRAQGRVLFFSSQTCEKGAKTLTHFVLFCFFLLLPFFSRKHSISYYVDTHTHYWLWGKKDCLWVYCPFFVVAFIEFWLRVGFLVTAFCFWSTSATREGWTKKKNRSQFFFLSHGGGKGKGKACLLGRASLLSSIIIVYLVGKWKT